MADTYLATWQDMCCRLAKLIGARPEGQTPGLLFHCFGGINRSSAALAAWMIFRHGVSAEAAIDALLSVRPGLHPWRNDRMCYGR